MCAKSLILSCYATMWRWEDRSARSTFQRRLENSFKFKEVRQGTEKIQWNLLRLPYLRFPQGWETGNSRRAHLYFDETLTTLSERCGEEDSSLSLSLLVRRLFISNEVYNEYRPDRSTPPVTDMLGLLRILTRTRTNTVDQHTVVHCSAGIGRTGTFVAIEMCLHQLLGEPTKNLDLVEIGKKIRGWKI